MRIKNYIAEIKANISIYTNKKTSNTLDGRYRSIYKGRSLDFDDLRAYVVGDDMKDVDWKSSARSGTMLIRRNNAEKKHNVMLILDAGKKMLADTAAGQPKKEVALMCAGVMAYLANKNGDYVGAVYSAKGAPVLKPLKCGLSNIETMLYCYDRDAGDDTAQSVEDLLDYVSTHLKKRMIFVVITDLAGLDSVQERTLRRTTLLHDILFINITDGYMSGKSAFDMDKDHYVPGLFLRSRELHAIEQKIKGELYISCLQKINRYRVTAVPVSAAQEVSMKIIELLEGHRYANIS